MITTAPPFVPSLKSGQALRLSKDERRGFQWNLNLASALTLKIVLGEKITFAAAAARSLKCTVVFLPPLVS
jgi:hypothetical protein